MSLCIFYLINFLMFTIITLGLVPVSGKQGKVFQMKAIDSQDPKGLIHSCLGSHSHRLPAAQPHNLAEGLVTGAWGSAEYTAYLPSLPIPAHGYKGAAPGQGRKTRSGRSLKVRVPQGSS